MTNHDPEQITDLVRSIVSRTLGSGRHRLIIGEDAVSQMPVGSEQTIPPSAIITPLAQQLAMERKINFIQETIPESSSQLNIIQKQPTRTSPEPELGAVARNTVAIGADHGGYGLKEQLKTWLNESGYGVIDCGTDSQDSVDYPDFAYAVAQLVAAGQAWRGIIIDGAGIGSCMAANKVPGIRAAMCYDQATAVNSREHNNANVLTLGAGLIGPNLAKQIVITWLATGFGGGRHTRRVDKIDAISRRYAK